MPEHVDHGVVWEPKGLGCSGRWRNTGTELPECMLLETEMGAIRWHAHSPLSEAHVHRHPKQDQLVGLGYVEHLEMTLYPWKIPVEELHWGRFLARDNFVVWIQWCGSRPLTVVYVNGRLKKEAIVSESGVSWQGGTLELSQPLVLREGPLVATALSKIPAVQSLFPYRILETYECKWRSAGEMTQNGSSLIGWAIHEIVRFDTMAQ